MTMRGIFADELGLKNDSRTVDAIGWIFWNEIPQADANEVRVRATITQGNGRSGTGWTEETYRRQDAPSDGKQEWRCDVPEEHGQQYAEGQAQARGWLVKTDDDADYYEWHVPCELS